MPTKRKVILGPEEEAIAKQAEKLTNLANRDFESIYGKKNTQQINFSQDPFVANKDFIATENNYEVQNMSEDKTIKETIEESKETEETMQEDTAEELPDDPVERAKKIHELLSKTVENPPSLAQILEWKKLHGDIFLIPISDNEVFLFRYLKRQEWTQFKATRPESMTDDQEQEIIFNKCVLFPRLDPIKSASQRAGLVPAVVKQIEIQSMFLNPEYIASITIKI